MNRRHAATLLRAASLKPISLSFESDLDMGLSAARPKQPLSSRTYVHTASAAKTNFLRPI